LEKLTLFAEDFRAKMSQSLASVLESLGNEVDYSGTQYDLHKKLKHKQSSWKMSQDFYQATTDAISESSSLLWPTQGIATLNGEFWIRNSSEYPSDAVESSLSEVLQTDAPARYSLSAKAAEGVLRRSNRGGKTLPDHLQKALEDVVGQVAQSAE